MRLRKEIFAFSRLAEADRNSLLSVLTNPATRRWFGAYGRMSPRFVAQFRATHDLWAGDPAFPRPAGASARRLS